MKKLVLLSLILVVFSLNSMENVPVRAIERLPMPAKRVIIESVPIERRFISQGQAINAYSDLRRFGN